MTTTRRPVRATVVIAVLACGLLGVTTVAAAQSSGHDYTDEANHTVALPDTTDHYPGEQNPRNASQQYWFAGKDGLRAEGAEDGIWVDRVVLRADWIDYSSCKRKHIENFGIDRGNDNSGTAVDDHYDPAETTFADGRVVVEFPDWGDFVGSPAYLAPEDAIVGYYGPSGTESGCLTMTDDPGWYRVTGYLNGTVADEDCTEEGNPSCEPSDKEYVDLEAGSTFVYVCECDSEEDARAELGPPPSEETATPSPTATQTAAGGSTPTATDEVTDTPTGTDGTAGDTDTTETAGTVPGTGTDTDTGTDGTGTGLGVAGTLLVFGAFAVALAVRRARLGDQ